MGRLLYFCRLFYIYISDCVVIKINRLQKYFFNALIVASASIIMHSISVSFNIFITGKIGSEAMGLVSLVSGVFGFGVTLATSGINLAVVRLVSSALPYSEELCRFDKKSSMHVRKIMTSALFYCLFFSLLSSILLFILSRAIGDFILADQRVIKSLRIMSFSFVPIAISSMLNGYFCAVRRVYKNVIVQFFEQGVKIFATSSLLMLFAPHNIEYACICIALGGLISELGSVSLNVILYFFDRNIHQKKKDDKEIIFSILSKNLGYVSEKPQKVPFFKRVKFFLKDTFKSRNNGVFSIAFPVAISAYVRSLLSTVENLAIPWGLKRSGLNSSMALSSYGVLCGFVFPLIFFPSSVLGAFASLLVPEISSSYEAKDFSRIRYITKRVFSFSLLFSLCVSGIFICFSNEIGVYFFKSNEAAELIKLLSPLIPLMYLDSAVDAILKGIGEQIYSMRVNIIDSFLSVILIIILLPKFGIYGYVLVIFITELLNTSLSIIRLLSKTGLKVEIRKWIVKPIISIILSTIITRLLFDFVFGGLSLYLKTEAIIKVVVCVTIYFVLINLFGAVSKSEYLLVKRAFAKEPGR